jgi:hypothetical protein
MVPSLVIRRGGRTRFGIQACRGKEVYAPFVSRDGSGFSKRLEAELTGGAGSVRPRFSTRRSFQALRRSWTVISSTKMTRKILAIESF